MWEGTILSVIWEIIKSIFTKKDPSIKTEEMLRDQAIHEQKAAPDVDDAIDGMRTRK